MDEGISNAEKRPMHDKNGNFAKGNPGGPGRPKGSLSLIGLLKKHLEEVPEGEKKTRAELFIEKNLKDAMRGDPTTKKLVWNYIEGLPQGKLDVTSGGKPLPILGDVQKDNGDGQDNQDA